MFENDHSAARGKMAVRELIVFKHDSELGSAPAYKLFDTGKGERTRTACTAARSYAGLHRHGGRGGAARRRHLHADGVIYPEEDFLQLSGLQHFAFCRRQWALIHIEQQWAENLPHRGRAAFSTSAPTMRTAAESRGRPADHAGDMRVFSPTLGVSGACDVVEFHRSRTGHSAVRERRAFGSPIRWNISAGKPKAASRADDLQLCGQAMCLEEMLCCEIPDGRAVLRRDRAAVQRWTSRRSCGRRCRTLLEEMHALYASWLDAEGQADQSLQRLLSQGALSAEADAEAICCGLSARHHLEETP